MFSLFKRKKGQPPATDAKAAAPAPDQPAQEAAAVPVDVQAPTVRVPQDSAQQDSVLPSHVPVVAPEQEQTPKVEPSASLPPQPVREPEPEPTIMSQAVAEPAPEPEPAPVAETSSWLARLKKGLSRTGSNLGSLFVGVKVDEDLFEELETALIMADAGVEATQRLLTALRARVRKERLADGAQVKAALRDILADHLSVLEKPFPLGKAAPLVIMIAGVNGAGKTTSIGKLANTFQAQGAKVLLAAGDTFRAAAREQLVEWGTRNNVTVISQEGGDPAAVAFDAVNAGRAREASVVMVDTAGRLPTQLHLMEELKKIKRVIGKADGAAPHEVLLVIDGNTGQNAIAQIRAFDAAIELTGLVVTKLDGTAKGGTLAAVAAGSQGVRPVPVYWIGVGEGINDLQPFVARDFATALLGD
ncbi:MAG: signal recognition particle-docking protein FtsY [Burkholderiaceae bacterium]|nr:signal recognition particle-docking protein FtsY [Burkholderiaceae bacterium]